MSKNGGCSGYAGKIQNTGSQMVKAPYGGSGGGSGKGTEKITGNDLRTGNHKSGK